MLLIFGASTSATGAFACATWPRCAWGTEGVDAQLVVHLGYRATVLLGTLAAAGEGKLTVSDVRAALHSRVRTAAVQTAPAKGLFLTKVFY